MPPVSWLASALWLPTTLKPRKMMGEMSYGMILCAEDKDGKLSILTTDDKDFESGSSIS